MTTTTSVTMSTARYAALTARAKADGITRPEVLRRALDDYTASPSMFAQGAASRDAEVKDLTDSLQLTGVQYRAAQGIIADLRAQVAELQEELHPAPVTVLFRIDLSKATLGPLTATGAGAIFGQPGKLASDAYWKHHTIVADPDGRRWLRWTTPKGTEGSSAGVSLAIPLARRVDEATLSMTQRLSPGFDPAYGFKFPGLSMTVPGGSGTLAGGGNDPGDLGSSCRGMIVKPVTGIFHQPDGTKQRARAPFEVTDYGYQKGNVEQERFTGYVPKPGVGFVQRKRIVLNSFTGAAPNADGLLQSWYADDGQQLGPGRDDQAETWRTRPDVAISHVFWSQFRGGANGDTRWASPVDGWVDIADGLKVTTPA